MIWGLEGFDVSDKATKENPIDGSCDGDGREGVHDWVHYAVKFFHGFGFGG